MTILRKWIAPCVIVALLAVTTFSPVARADELRLRDAQGKTALEGNRGRGGRRGGGGGRRHHGGGSGWAWAGLGAAVGLGVLAAVTRDDSPSYTYVQPAPSYQVVYPSTTYYYPSTTYTTTSNGYPVYVQPNYGQTYYGQSYAQPVAPCNACP